MPIPMLKSQRSLIPMPVRKADSWCKAIGLLLLVQSGISINVVLALPLLQWTPWKPFMLNIFLEGFTLNFLCSRWLTVQCIHMMDVMEVFFIGVWLTLNILALLRLFNILILLGQRGLFQDNAKARLKVILKLFLIYKSMKVALKLRDSC